MNILYGTKKNPPAKLKMRVIDIHKELPKKSEALSKYKSQISKCFKNQEEAVLNEDFVKTFRSNTEKFYTEG
jgi:hypothetical protein